MCIVLIAGTTGFRISAVCSSQLNQQNPSSAVFVTGCHPCLSTTFTRHRNRPDIRIILLAIEMAATCRAFCGSGGLGFRLGGAAVAWDAEAQGTSDWKSGLTLMIVATEAPSRRWHIANSNSAACRRL
jgi:hypothetical protein